MQQIAYGAPRHGAHHRFNTYLPLICLSGCQRLSSLESEEYESLPWDCSCLARRRVRGEGGGEEAREGRARLSPRAPIFISAPRSRDLSAVAPTTAMPRSVRSRASLPPASARSPAAVANGAAMLKAPLTASLKPVVRFFATFAPLFRPVLVNFAPDFNARAAFFTPSVTRGGLLLGEGAGSGCP